LVEVERKPLITINRDTEHALNSIKLIFDKADVKERMEYVNAISDEGFKLIGDIAMKQVQKYEEKVANTSDGALKKRYQKEADKWKDGGIYKIALHSGFGAVVSDMAGGSSLKGFTVASANEVMVGAIAKELATHPNSIVDANGKYVDNFDIYKILVQY
jgi:filamentous hemagglutinin family N-terminal domain protein